VLLGQPRLIRHDDWAVHLPLALAQLHHDPPFPLVNRDIGLGQSALVPFELPVAHPFTLLRPQLLGFFLGPDVGIAWMWWTRMLGSFGVWLAVFAVLSGGRLGLSALGSALLVFSPFFQFWSLNPASVTTALGLGFLALVALLRARGGAAIAASAAGLAAAGGAFLLALYPPYQITLAWLGVALAIGFVLAERPRLPLREHIGLRVLALLGAAVCVAALGAAYFGAAAADVARIRGSVYPGSRVALGGERSLFDLLNVDLGAPLWLGVQAWAPLGNVCEAASFLFLGPLVVGFDMVRRIAGGERIDPLSAAVALYAAVLAVFVLAGFPESAAKASLLANVPGQRAVLGLGVADAILLVRFLGRERASGTGGRGVAALLAAAWGLVLAVCALALHRTLPELPVAALFGAAGLQALLGYLLLVGPGRMAALVALVVASAASSLWFNPLAAGGAEDLTGSAVARAALEIDRSSGGRTTWVVFGRAEFADLLRSVGIHTLNGVLPVPQPELWHRVDPEGRYEDAYNRYASATFVAGGRALRIESRRPASFFVSVDPGSPALRSLGATHVLVDRGEPRAFSPQRGFEELAQVGSARLYRVSAAPSAAPRAPPASASPPTTR